MTNANIPQSQKARNLSYVEERAPTLDDLAALERLIAVAKSDTGQGRKCASFLLAWWNASACGGFDLVDLWAVDADIARDMIQVFSLISRLKCYPNIQGYRADFEAIIDVWHPELAGG